MMDINVTLIGQMITFAVFVWFTMKFVWPPITKAMDDRAKKIADGLAAAERGQHDMELAQHKAAEVLAEAKQTAVSIVDQANLRAENIINEAQQKASQDADRLIKRAQEEFEQEANKARHELQAHVATLAVQVAEKILKRSIDAKTQEQILNGAMTEI